MDAWGRADLNRPGFLKSVFDVRPSERPVAALMCTYFFLVITSFWILKPIKKTLFIGHFAESGVEILGRHLDAPGAELVAKVLNMFVAAAAATLFALLSRKLRRQRLSFVFTAFFVLGYALFAWILLEPGDVSVFAFYLFGDLFSTLMVATFFAFLNDSVSPDAAKRLYGLVGFGGVFGGVFGSSAVATWIDALSVQAWLGVAAVVAGVIVLVAAAAARSVARAEGMSRAAEEVEGADEEDDAEDDAGGIALVLRSPYLLSIVAIVGLYELVSTILDYQFTSTVFQLVEDSAARSRHYATVFAATNWLSMTIQLLGTSYVMRRFGVGTALLVLPCAIALASTGYLWMPTLLFGSLLSVSDNGFSYSINQSSKEALYVPTTVREKYQAKAFIDMFVQRFAKALGVGLGLLMATFAQGLEGVRLLSLVVLPAIGAWSFAAAYAGRRFRALEESAKRQKEEGVGSGV